MNGVKKSYGKRVSRLGYVDIEMRDEDNNTVFKRRGQKLGKGIKDFEKFLDEKYGLKGILVKDIEDYLKKRFGLKGFSAHDFENYVKSKK